MILRCENISKSFGANLILDKVTFHVQQREKVAIVGANGAGKSTLFKIIAGELAQDEGQIILKKGSSLGYLAQQQDLSSENSIYDEMMSVKEDIINLYSRIRQLQDEMKHLDGSKLEQKLDTYTRLVHEFEDQNGYACQSEVTGILKGLGFEEDSFEKKLTLFQEAKTRIALGKLLLLNPDLFYLTNQPTT